MLSRRFRKQQRGRRWLTALALVSVVSGTLLVGGAVLASTPAGLFELEGNATSTANGAAPDDWDRVCYEQSLKSMSASAAAALCSTDDDTNGAVAVAWAEDVHGALGPLGECTGTNCTIFTGGGSKDPIDINQWAWKDNAGGLPDKDNLLHSFAARYSIPSSGACPGAGGDTTGATKCEMLFFGNDRYDNSGDAHQAFWFFQNKIGLGTNAIGGGQGFTSSGGTEFHRNGDLLLISNFSNGGAVSTITIYTWDTGCTQTNIPKSGPVSGVSCGDANLRFQASSAAANCNPVNPAITGFCGIVNPTTNTVAPWPYVDKTTTNDTTHLPNTYLQGEFYEGGVNLSFLNLSGSCFASVASETRASTSTTAVLKDFVLGEFGDCTSSVTTTPKTGAGGAISADANNNTVPDLSIGTGSVTVRDQATVAVNGVSTWTGSVAFTLCKLPLTPITANCASGGVAIPYTAPANGNVSDAAPTVNSPVTTLTSVGRYCWRAVFTSNVTGVPGAVDPAPTSTSTTECFEVLPVQPSLSTQAGGPVAAGGTMTDTATISGLATKPGTNGIGSDGSINATNGAGATGTINWTAFGPDNCTTALTVTPSSITINGNNNAGNPSYGPVSATTTTAGLYTFVASYTTADVNNLSIGASACPDPTDTEEVTASTSSITTTPKTGAGASISADANNNTVPDLSIGTGSVTVRDQATVTVNGLTTWTGSVAFTLCKLPLTPITANCSAGGVSIPFTAPDTGAVSNSSPTVNGPVTTLTSVGRYCWRAVFTSSTTGVPNSVDPTPTSTSTTECFEVLPVRPTLVTQATIGPITLGGSIGDTATISLLATQPGTGGLGDGSINPTTPGVGAGGSITFIAYGPNNCTTVAMSTTSRTVSGNGTYPKTGSPDNQAAVSFIPTALGVYTFVADYTGDGLNNLASTPVACADQPSNEKVEIKGVSNFTTAQDWLPNDTATLTGDANLNGTLTFALYNDATCGQNSGIVKYSKSVTVTNAASGTSFSTDNTTFVVKAGDGSSWSWLVTYNDTTLDDPANSCKEITSITINNNFTAP